MSENVDFRVSFSTILTVLSDLQEGKEYLRNYQQPNPRSYTRSKGYDFRNGHTGKLLYSHGVSWLSQNSGSVNWIIFHQLNTPWAYESDGKLFCILWQLFYRPKSHRYAPMYKSWKVMPWKKSNCLRGFIFLSSVSGFVMPTLCACYIRSTFLNRICCGLYMVYWEVFLAVPCNLDARISLYIELPGYYNFMGLLLDQIL